MVLKWFIFSKTNFIFFHLKLPSEKTWSPSLILEVNHNFMQNLWSNLWKQFFKRPSKSNHFGLPIELSSTIIFITFFGGGCQETNVGDETLLGQPKAFFVEWKRVVIWVRIFQKKRLLPLKGSSLCNFHII